MYSKKQSSEYNKKYYQQNKNKLQKRNKKYYKDNKDEILKHQKEYYQGNKEKCLTYTKEYKKNNKNKCCIHQKKHTKITNGKDQKAARARAASMVIKIKEHYGCLNPNCQWKSPLKPCCLDFHHIDNTNKMHVSQMYNHGIKSICKEINKCTLLCAICHRLATYDNLNCEKIPRCTVMEDGTIQSF